MRLERIDARLVRWKFNLRPEEWISANDLRTALTEWHEGMFTGWKT